LKHDVIDPLIAEIDRLEARVADLEKQLAALRAAPASTGDSTRHAGGVGESTSV